MKRRTLSMICAAMLSCVGLTASRGMADEDEQQSVTLAFGGGLNTAQQNNVVNNVMLPNDVKINQGGVLHSLVAGFHQPAVYKPGTKPEDIMVPTTGAFIDGPTNRFYLGINPAGGPLNTPATIDPSNARNRVESVGFPATEGIVGGVVVSAKAEPGIYLVICNVRQHFQTGMFGFVEIKAQRDRVK